MKYYINRQSNMELLRIIAIFFIIIFHLADNVVVHQLTNADATLRWNNGYFNYPYFYKRLLILVSLRPCGRIGNGLFLLISGYFMIEKDKINLFNIAKKLLLQQGYAVVFLALASFVYIHLMKAKVYTPISLVSVTDFNTIWWFTGYYFIIITLAALFLNRFFKRLEEFQFRTILISLFALVSFSWSAGVIDSLANGLRTVGIGVFLYLLGAYIKKYNPFEKLRVFILLIVAILVYMLIYLSYYNNVQARINNYILDATAKKSSGNTVESFIQSIPEYIDWSIVVVVLAVIIFELFRRIRIPNNGLINYIASGTFMVFLIHNNSFIRQNFWMNRDWIKLLYYTPIKFISGTIIVGIFTFTFGIAAYTLYLLLCKIISRYEWLFIQSNRE